MKKQVVQAINQLINTNAMQMSIPKKLSKQKAIQIAEQAIEGKIKNTKMQPPPLNFKEVCVYCNVRHYCAQRR
ncbi:MAG: hypothetical protein R3F23_02810 [Verrucomicrobiia bacterium]